MKVSFFYLLYYQYKQENQHFFSENPSKTRQL